jgi:ribonuclease HI
MDDGSLVTIYTDGASRGNPGPAAFAFVLSRPGEETVEEAGLLGELTNNQAEYTALVRALECALGLGKGHRLAIHSDSELMVKQMRGEYRVKDEGLKPFYEDARDLWDQFRHRPTITHVPRSCNGRADELCNLVLDGKRLPAAAAKPPGPAAEVDALAVALLGEAARAWSRGDPLSPSPEGVWKKLRKLLEEKGAGRRKK